MHTHSRPYWIALVICAFAPTAAQLQGPSPGEREIAIASNEDDQARTVYLSGKFEKAVPLFTTAIDRYEKLLAKDSVSAPMRQALQYDLLLAHGRLAVSYDQLGRRNERDKHLHLAVMLSADCMNRPFESSSEVLSLVADVDRNYGKRK